MKNKLLRNGVEMPEVGFGTWKAGETDGFAVLSEAIRAGYRHIDTASAYHTEEAVGRAVAASGVDRSEFFITTKAWKDQLGYDRTLAAFDASCQALGMDYLDLYLIHWPRPDAACEEWKELDRGSWRAMEELYRQGRIRAIGVCSFYPDRLADLIAFNEIPPAVNQVECNVFFQQTKAQDYMKSKGVQMQSWAPFAEGHNDLFHNETLTAIGAKYGKSVAQVVLRWQLQRGIVCIPKSTKKERMAQNFDVFDFTLSQADMDAIAALDTGVSSFFDHRDPAVVEMLAGLVRKI